LIKNIYKKLESVN